MKPWHILFVIGTVAWSMALMRCIDRGNSNEVGGIAFVMIVWCIFAAIQMAYDE